MNTEGGQPVEHFYSDKGPPKGEFVFVGSKDEFFARMLILKGFEFSEDNMAPPSETADIASYYRASGTSIYFVSPPAREANAAVSSKP